MAAAGYCTLEWDAETGGRGDRADHLRGPPARADRRRGRRRGQHQRRGGDARAGRPLLARRRAGLAGAAGGDRRRLPRARHPRRVGQPAGGGGHHQPHAHRRLRARAAGPETRAILRVHPSNFRQVGFTEEAGLDELAALASERGLALIDDLGSGSLEPWPPHGDEPDARASVAAGASLVCFSADKLLGGPQAGILVGTRGGGGGRARPSPDARAPARQAAHRRARGHARAAPRPGRRAAAASRRWRCWPTTGAARGARARALAAAVGGEVVETVGRVGGGALPLAELPSAAVALDAPDGPDALAGPAAGASIRRWPRACTAAGCCSTCSPSPTPTGRSCRPWWPARAGERAPAHGRDRGARRSRQDRAGARADRARHRPAARRARARADDRAGVRAVRPALGAPRVAGRRARPRALRAAHDRRARAASTPSCSAWPPTTASCRRRASTSTCSGLLGIARGVVAVTRADLADPAPAAAAARELLGPSVPVIPVCAPSGEGIPALRAALDRLAGDLGRRTAAGPARLFIDRVFSVAGAGTVVTGTHWGAPLVAGRPGHACCRAAPGGGCARSRPTTVRWTGRPAAASPSRSPASPGRRRRAASCVVGDGDGWEPTGLLDVALTWLPGAGGPLRTRRRLQAFLGTAEVPAVLRPARGGVARARGHRARAAAAGAPGRRARRRPGRAALGRAPDRRGRRGRRRPPAPPRPAERRAAGTAPGRARPAVAGAPRRRRRAWPRPSPRSCRRRASARRAGPTLADALSVSEDACAAALAEARAAGAVVEAGGDLVRRRGGRRAPAPPRSRRSARARCPCRRSATSGASDAATRSRSPAISTRRGSPGARGTYACCAAARARGDGPGLFTIR